MRWLFWRKPVRVFDSYDDARLWAIEETLRTSKWHSGRVRKDGKVAVYQGRSI